MSCLCTGACRITGKCPVYETPIYKRPDSTGEPSESTARVQTYYVIKRDEEPRCELGNPNYWDNREEKWIYDLDPQTCVMTKGEAGYVIKDVKKTEPTARIVKIELREVDGE